MFSIIPVYLFLGSNNCKVEITYNVTLWRFHLAIVAIETQKLFLCTVVDLHMTVNKMKPLSAAVDTPQWISLQRCIATKYFIPRSKK
jgi:hypothetical protein